MFPELQEHNSGYRTPPCPSWPVVPFGEACNRFLDHPPCAPSANWAYRLAHSHATPNWHSDAPLNGGSRGSHRMLGRFLADCAVVKVGSNRSPPSVPPGGNARVRPRTPLRRPSARKKRGLSLTLQAAQRTRVRRWPPSLRACARRPRWRDTSNHRFLFEKYA